MNLFLRFAILGLLVVPVCLELQTAAARNIEARNSEAGLMSVQDTGRLAPNQRKLYDAIQARQAANLHGA